MKIHKTGLPAAIIQPEAWIGLDWICTCGAHLELNSVDDFASVAGVENMLILTECPFCNRPKTFHADYELKDKFRREGRIVDKR